TEYKSYDADHVLKESRTAEFTYVAGKKTIIYKTIDAEGNLLKKEVREREKNANGGYNTTLSISYNANDEMTNKNEYTYYENGRHRTEKYSSYTNGSLRYSDYRVYDENGKTQTYYYENYNNGKLSNRSESSYENGRQIGSINISYENDGVTIRETREYKYNSNGKETECKTYDADHVLKECHTAEYTYTAGKEIVTYKYYDAEGNYLRKEVQEREKNTNGGYNTTLSTSYNANDEMTEKRENTYYEDGMHRTQKYSSYTNGSLSYSDYRVYDENGKTQTYYYENYNSGKLSNRSESSYENGRRIGSINTSYESDGVTVREISEYKYDSDGDETECKSYDADHVLKESRTAEFTYAAGKKTIIYKTIDAEGNLLKKQVQEMEKNADGGYNTTLNVVYNANGELNYKNEYTYYEDGRRRTGKYSGYTNGSLRHLNYSVYDENGNTQTYYYENYNSGKLSNRSESSYENGRKTGEIQTYYESDGVTIRETREYKYNSDGEETEYKSYDADHVLKVHRTTEYSYAAGKKTIIYKDIDAEGNLLNKKVQEQEKYANGSNKSDIWRIYNKDDVLLSENETVYYENGDTHIYVNKRYEYSNDGVLQKIVVDKWTYDNEGNGTYSGEEIVPDSDQAYMFYYIRPFMKKAFMC
nr:hypothetical protein [Lachnospiraceae bacterium]